jgi:hypothetical protein
MALAFDTFSTESRTATNNLIWSHTCTGSNRAVLVGLTSKEELTAITFASQAMTLIKRMEWSSSGGVISYLYYLKNPPSGSSSVSVTFAGIGPFSAGVMSFTGANIRSPLESFGFDDFSDTNVTLDVTTVSANALVADFFSVDGNAVPTAGAGQTEQWTNEVTTGTVSVRTSGSTEPKATPGTVTMSWTTANFPSILIVAVLRDTDATGIRSTGSAAPLILRKNP